MLLLLLLGLALARPSLRSSLFSIDQKAPVHAVLILDTSLSMQYRSQGKSRLDEAKAQARRVVQELPEGSEIVVLDSGAPQTTASLDVPTAIARLESLELLATPRVLNEALAAAYRTLAKSQQERREVYIFSDVASSSWNLADSSTLAEQAGLTDRILSVYLIDVGVDEPENVAITGAALSQEVLSKNAELKLSVSVHNTGPDADRSVELEVDGQPRDNKPVRLPAGQTTEIAFRLAGLEEGFHQGVFRAAADDPMPFDDARSFTVEVRPPTRVLVLSDRPEDAEFWVSALAPRELAAQQRARYLVDAGPPSRLGSVDLADYSVVALLNVGQLPQDGWIKLSNFVQSGGGVFIAVGERVDPVAYDTAGAQTILPARLLSEKAPPQPVYVSIDRFTHPLLAKFREWGTGELADRPVLRYFQVDPAVHQSAVIANFSDGSPALVERAFGQGKRGRTILWTTAAHYRPTGDAWTEIPLGWSYLALADQIVRYLAGSAEAKWNYLAGQPIAIEVDPGAAGALFSITDPAGEFERLSVDPTETSLVIPPPKHLGNYRVDAGEAVRPFSCRFSVNEPAEESVLTKIPADRLAELIGKDRLRIARDPSQIEQVVGEARVGRELFPWLMILVIALVVAEGYLANRFYPKAAEPVPA